MIKSSKSTKWLDKIGSFLKFYWVGVLISLIFFVVGIITLSHYGNNIDEPMHFEKGNAYLDFFLTGREKYTDADFTSKRISEWKYRGFDTAFFLKTDCCHPSLNDILAAGTNRVLYGQFGIMGDLESYHVFELFISTLLIFLVFAMIRRRYGIFAGTIASLSIALYPLFYGEARFNIKDPIEASFFAFTLYFFYLGVEKARAKYFLISSIFCALAFGTKFNIIFLPFIIIPYLLVRFGFSFNFKKIPKRIYLSLFIYPIIVLGVNFIFRPYLWQDPINRFLSVAQYYKDIGTGTDYQSAFLKFGWNTYPTFFVGISTPLIILGLFLVGVVIALFRVKREKDKFSFLILLWFAITILRVSIPGTSIYGGVRQIMEYVPAMAAISGLGALYLRSLLSRYINIKLASIIIFAAFVPLMATLVRLHPNENLFINSLVGGLKGATEKKI
ncbi:MAG: glycosyltransferase family 39 protein [Candidatus Levybacteria bacterium]|nr:glycosyltransferase family 39 protein [Candidatus Levybacteria bacterium]